MKIPFVLALAYFMTMVHQDVNAVNTLTDRALLNQAWSKYKVDYKSLLIALLYISVFIDFLIHILYRLHLRNPMRV
jgi:hypothetical protein